MTSRYSETRGEPVDSPGSGSRVVRLLVLVATPLLLGTLFLVHPDGSGGLAGLLPLEDTWLVLHLAMLPLLGLLGVAFYLLLEGYTGTVATVGRAGVALYLTFYTAFEAIAGIATGLLVHEAHTAPADQQAGLATAVETLTVPSMVLGVFGILGAILAVTAIGILLRRSGAPLVPVLLLGGAPLATVFHAGTPLDAVGMALFLGGVVWLEVGWRNPGEPPATPTA